MGRRGLRGAWKGTGRMKEGWKDGRGLEGGFEETGRMGEVWKGAWKDVRGLKGGCVRKKNWCFLTHENKYLK